MRIIPSELQTTVGLGVEGGAVCAPHSETVKVRTALGFQTIRIEHLQQANGAVTCHVTTLF